MMFSLSNGTSFKTINRNQLYHFIITLHEPIKNWNKETMNQLLIQLSDYKEDIVIISFEKGINRQDFLSLNKLFNELNIDNLRILFTINKEPLVAKEFITNLFKSDRILSKMINSSNSFQIPIEKDELILIVLQLIEIKAIVNEDEIMEIVATYKNLKEIA